MNRVGGLALVLVLSTWALAGCGTSKVTAASSTPATVVIDWNNTAVNAIRAGVKFQAEGLIYMTYVQAAVYDAVTAIEGGYRQYRTNLSAPEGASSEAAAAAAAHDVLLNLFPAQASSLGASLATSLSTIPDGTAKTRGITVGQQAALAIISLRAGDVRSGNDGYVFGSGPGVWRLPTPDSTAAAPQTPWIRSLAPFMLQSPSQFRADPPPALSSTDYAAQLAEVQAYGGVGSTVRTDEQATTAKFWTANVINQYNLFLRMIASGRSMKIVEASRLLAMGNMVSADASIACWDSKYAYSFWRPVEAIRVAAVNPDPKWKPFLAPTPNHPEYPSAHGCLTSALLTGIGILLGTKDINVDIPGLNPATGTLDPSYTRHFQTEKDALYEMEGARVWAGYHYRGSVIAGANLGRQVAHYTLARNFLAG